MTAIYFFLKIVLGRLPYALEKWSNLPQFRFVCLGYEVTRALCYCGHKKIIKLSTAEKTPCLLNSVCCGNILQSSPFRILALFHFFSKWRCLGKSNIIGSGFAFVGPRPHSNQSEHIQVCFVTLRLSSRYAVIHLRHLSPSFQKRTVSFSSLIFDEKQ